MGSKPRFRWTQARSAIIFGPRCTVEVSISFFRRETLENRIESRFWTLVSEHAPFKPLHNEIQRLVGIVSCSDDEREARDHPRLSVTIPSFPTGSLKDQKYRGILERHLPTRQIKSF